MNSSAFKCVYVCVCVRVQPQTAPCSGPQNSEAMDTIIITIMRLCQISGVFFLLSISDEFNV